MALNLERFLRALALALCLIPGAAKAAPAFDSPTGLTLVVQAGGRYLMLWDPIYRDDLLGYSVWLRKPGDAEFMRLSVPVKVGKEVKKQPLTPEAKVVLAFGRERDDLEMAVVAEYEDGASARSAVARSAGARRGSGAPPVVAPDAGPTGASANLSPTSTVRQRADALADDGAPAPKGETPWDKAKERALRPLILAPGKWGSALGVGFDRQTFVTKGTMLVDVITIGATITESTQLQAWKRTDTRTVFSAPVELHYGVASGIELWGEADYRYETASFSDYTQGGLDFGGGTYEVMDAQGHDTFVAGPSSSGLGDVLVGVRGQPMAGQPLVASLQASIPTGTSRFISMLNFVNGEDGAGVGTGEGVLRFKVGLDWGQPGRQPGLAFHAAYSPSATESTNNRLPYILTTTALSLVHGDVAELGGAYTFPWTLAGWPGALAVGLGGQSIAAARLSSNGRQIAYSSTADYAGELAALSGVEFGRDDRMELSLTAVQDLSHGFETRAKAAYIVDAMGDEITLSGQFLY